jgi:hypothetical protein
MNGGWRINTRHSPGSGIVQSIFSAAARPQRGWRRKKKIEGRDGGLKMDWTKPMHERLTYVF